MRPIILFSLLFLCSLRAVSLDDAYASLSFQPSFGSQNLQLNKYYYTSKSDSIKIETLKFYISGIEFMNDEKSVWQEKNSFHLIDVSDITTLKIFLQTNSKLEYNQLKFNLGIDSTTNVSGAMGGDLDPTKGMYWTWQSGYINCKLEGKSNLAANRTNEFQFHLGGYANPCYALQTVILDVKKSNAILINLDLEKIVSAINLDEQTHIMSPAKHSVDMARVIAANFFVSEK